MIFTITANLLAETTAYYKDATRGHTHRAQRESFQVGGKGINVAKMVHKLGLVSEALCFPAGNNGQRCIEWLQGQSFASKAFIQTGETRAGWVIRLDDAAETTFLGMDQPVQSEAWTQAFDYLKTTMSTGDWLAFSGSIPGWNDELAASIDAFLREKHGAINVAVDSYGPPLEWFKNQPVQLVKINRKELRILVGDFTARQLPGILRNLRRTTPPANWIITDGPRTIYGIDSEGTVLRVDPPKVDEVSPVGCGDIVLAGIMAGLCRGGSLRDALTLALPLATANAARADVAEFDPSEVESLPLSAVEVLSNSRVRAR